MHFRTKRCHSFNTNQDIFRIMSSASSLRELAFEVRAYCRDNDLVLVSSIESLPIITNMKGVLR